MKKNKSIKRDIAEAVENIPGMIINQVELPPPRPHATRQPKHANLLMWVGVISISLVIFVIWIFNAKTMLSEIGIFKSAEGQMINVANQDMKTILNSLSETGDTTKTTVNKIIDAANAEEAKYETIKSIKAEFDDALTTTSTSSTDIFTTSTTSTEAIVTSTTS